MSRSVTNTTDSQQTLVIDGQPLSIEQVCKIANSNERVGIETDDELEARMESSVALVERAVDEQWNVYGVTTGFGGMAGISVPADQAAASQNNLLSFLATGAGAAIERRHVRGAMLLRANVLAQGLSGVRPELVNRLLRFVELGATPVVRELGSIGASGDLVPLSAIARAITGQSNNVKVQVSGSLIDGQVALDELGYEPLELRPKEGLALVNGTSFSSAIAANCLYETKNLMVLALGAQSMMLQAMLGQDEPLDAFVHQHKPHPGQIWTAKVMRQLLHDRSRPLNGKRLHVQDRYSLRCLPQYMGSVVEAIARISQVIETEMNSVSDNPLIDTEQERFCQSGNFLGQYLGIAMDDLRRSIGLMAKHLDVQIATLVTPEFNNGLPASLCGNSKVSYNMGLKGLQITGNSIMPMLTYLGNPLVEHFPTHAEQFNQNINGLSWGAANMAWKSVELFQHYMAVSLIFSIQALDLRAKACFGHYDGAAMLGPDTIPLYEAVCQTVDSTRGADEPFLFNDSDRWLEENLTQLYQNIQSHGAVVQAVEPLLQSFNEQNF